MEAFEYKTDEITLILILDDPKVPGGHWTFSCPEAGFANEIIPNPPGGGLDLCEAEDIALGMLESKVQPCSLHDLTTQVKNPFSSGGRILPCQDESLLSSSQISEEEDSSNLDFSEEKPRFCTKHLLGFEKKTPVEGLLFPPLDLKKIEDTFAEDFLKEKEILKNHIRQISDSHPDLEPLLSSLEKMILSMFQHIIEKQMGEKS